MKTINLSILRVVLAALFFTLIFSQNLQAQQEYSNIFFEITKIKKMNDDFFDVEDQLIKPFIQERIKQGNQLAHVLFRVHYPASDDATYDYVMMGVFQNFEDLHLENKKFTKIAYQAFPNANIPKMVERYDAAIHVASSQVFENVAEAVPGPGGAKGSKAKFVKVNHMKVAAGNFNAYQKMEREIFMPLHKEAIKTGTMHDWVMAQRILPFGSDWDNTFMTFDVFANWGDMNKGLPAGTFAKVHPGKNTDKIWDEMMNLREMTRSETWEVIDVVSKPTPEITAKVLKEGTGANPMKGQEVEFKTTVMNLKGEELFSTDVLGFHFYSTIGENYYDTFFDKHLQTIKKGGVTKLKVPAEAQDGFVKGLTGGETALINVEVFGIDSPKPNGAKLLKKKIEKHGLSYAKEKYNKLQVDNPKGYVFREGGMNNLGYELLQDGKTQSAIYIFELNTKLNPKSWNACDSLADGYRAAGNIAKAKHCYKMALEINPDFQAARDKLSKL
jgi:hypothetical protein